MGLERLEAVCIVTQINRYSLYLEARFLFQQGPEEMTGGGGGVRGRNMVRADEESGEPCLSLGCCETSVSFLSNVTP